MTNKVAVVGSGMQAEMLGRCLVKAGFELGVADVAAGDNSKTFVLPAGIDLETGPIAPLATAPWYSKFSKGYRS